MTLAEAFVPRRGLVLVVAMNDAPRAATLHRLSGHVGWHEVHEVSEDRAADGRVDPRKGLFAPDAIAARGAHPVLLVEETRDSATVAAVLSAAEACLVLTSVRGPDLASGLDRLVDAGAPWGAVVAVLRLVVHVRRADTGTLVREALLVRDAVRETLRAATPADVRDDPGRFGVRAVTADDLAVAGGPAGGVDPGSPESS